MPITEIKVDSIQNIKQLIIETQKDDTIGRYRSPALFRGLPNSTYTLQTSLYRNCKEKSIELETSILRNFYKYALPTAIMIHAGREWLLDNIMVFRLV